MQRLGHFISQEVPDPSSEHNVILCRHDSLDCHQHFCQHFPGFDDHVRCAGTLVLGQAEANPCALFNLNISRHSISSPISPGIVMSHVHIVRGLFFSSKLTYLLNYWRFCDFDPFRGHFLAILRPFTHFEAK